MQSRDAQVALRIQRGTICHHYAPHTENLAKHTGTIRMRPQGRWKTDGMGPEKGQRCDKCLWRNAAAQSILIMNHWSVGGGGMCGCGRGGTGKTGDWDISADEAVTTTQQPAKINQTITA